MEKPCLAARFISHSLLTEYCTANRLARRPLKALSGLSEGIVFPISTFYTSSFACHSEPGLAMPRLARSCRVCQASLRPAATGITAPRQAWTAMPSPAIPRRATSLPACHAGPCQTTSGPASPSLACHAMPLHDRPRLAGACLASHAVASQAYGHCIARCLSTSWTTGPSSDSW